MPMATITATMVTMAPESGALRRTGIDADGQEKETDSQSQPEDWRDPPSKGLRQVRESEVPDRGDRRARPVLYLLSAAARRG